MPFRMNASAFYPQALVARLQIGTCPSQTQAGSLCYRYIRVHPWLNKNALFIGLENTGAVICTHENSWRICVLLAYPLSSRSYPSILCIRFIPSKKLVSTGCPGSTGNRALRAQRLCERINKSRFSLFTRLRRRFAPRNDGISNRALSTTNHGKFTNRCLPAAGSSWKLVLYRIKKWSPRNEPWCCVEDEPGLGVRLDASDGVISTLFSFQPQLARLLDLAPANEIPNPDKHLVFSGLKPAHVK